jgi:hypothetical protein
MIFGAYTNPAFAELVQLRDLIKQEDISDNVSSWENAINQYHTAVFGAQNTKKVRIDPIAKQKFMEKYLTNLGQVDTKKMDFEVFKKLGAKYTKRFIPNLYNLIQGTKDPRPRFIRVGFTAFKISILKSDIYRNLNSAYQNKLNTLSYDDIISTKSLTIGWLEIKEAIESRDCYTLPCPVDDCKIEDGKCVENTIKSIAGL